MRRRYNFFTFCRVNVDKLKPLCGRFDVKGFPTVKIFVDGKAHDYPGNFVFLFKFLFFIGQRTSKDLHDYILSVLPSYVKSITSKNVATFLSSSLTLPKVLLFTDKSTTSPLYKSYSTDYNGKMVFGEINRSQKELLNKYDVASFPTLMVLPPDSDPVRFEGVFQPRSIKSFLNSFLVGEVDEDALPLISDQSCFNVHWY